jgi:hypothetical protein
MAWHGMRSTPEAHHKRLNGIILVFCFMFACMATIATIWPMQGRNAESERQHHRTVPTSMTAVTCASGMIGRPMMVSCLDPNMKTRLSLTLSLTSTSRTLSVTRLSPGETCMQIYTVVMRHAQAHTCCALSVQAGFFALSCHQICHVSKHLHGRWALLVSLDLAACECSDFNDTE